MFDNYFDKIYCINLDSRPERWELAKQEFESVGIKNYTRFSAVKGVTGQQGCRDSHIQIMKDAKQNDYKRILIFEDDFVFNNKDQETIKKVLDDMVNINYDIFYFGATVDTNTGHFRMITDNFVNTNFAYATHAYTINPRLYDVVINEAPFHPIIDVFYQNRIVRRGGCFISNPMLCLQRQSYSDVENTIIDYDWMVDHFNIVLNRSNGKN